MDQQFWNIRQKILVAVAIVSVTSLVIWRIPSGILLPATLLLSWMLLSLSLTDLRYMLLPDRLTLSLLWLGLISNAAGLLPSVQLAWAVSGAAVGYTSLFLLSRSYRFFAKKEGLGLGDAKLLAALGAWLGVYRLPTIILIASSIAIVMLLASWMFTGRDLSKPFPFGPTLAFAGWAVFLWQHG
ncbi:A24 family peptidase [Pantoea sp. CCBC3-3-1]|uniref:prepilin peptidase n=1 Tax=Pantoea sp. CCBC3-3-1 TaxID=2490851 RepID=UPI0011BE93CB|nr:A24 family peptidase [Pantoea sp. CCBC3-3-1]